jgi:hypothetical protein
MQAMKSAISPDETVDENRPRTQVAENSGGAAQTPV